ncbi:MAG TPA: response regulator [Candidatus Saccharimonadales bacterium]|nr:response regulator [Candidatus Saccharimonadales bacterium]
MKILIVDDSKTMRLIVKRALRQAGFEDHEVEEAGNGLEALEMLKAGGIEVVLCDWNMPQMNGLALLNAVREQGFDVKFGFVTSEGGPEIEKTAADAGALFLISKPFTADVLQRVLGPVLQ